MPDSRSAIVSSAHGQLRQLLVAFASDQIKEVLVELCKTLPSYTQIIIWVPTNQRRLALTQFLLSLNIPFEFHQPGFTSTSRCLILSPKSPDVFIECSSWVQDPFLVLADRESGYLQFLQPPTCAGTGRNQGLSSHLVDSGFPVSNHTIPWFHIQGGNCLVGDDFMLIGKADFQQTMALLKFKDPATKDMSFSELEKYTQQKICSTLGIKQVFPVGTAHFIPPSPCLPDAPHIYRTLNQGLTSTEYGHPQPFPHLDQYLSLAGRDEKTKIYQLVMAEIIPVTGTKDDETKAQELNRHLTAIAKKLKKQGPFQVFRNPVPLLPGNHFNYYNNCLLEITRQAKKTIWLPQFGSENPLSDEWDHKNATIWQKLGFDIIPLNHLYSFSLKRGAIHCLTKYLRRD